MIVTADRDAQVIVEERAAEAPPPPAPLHVEMPSTEQRVQPDETEWMPNLLRKQTKVRLLVTT